MKGIIVFIITWIAMIFVFAFIGWTFNGFEQPYTNMLKHDVVHQTSLFIGWLPALIVSVYSYEDLD